MVYEHRNWLQWWQSPPIEWALTTTKRDKNDLVWSINDDENERDKLMIAKREYYRWWWSTPMNLKKEKENNILKDWKDQSKRSSSSASSSYSSCMSRERVRWVTVPPRDMSTLPPDRFCLSSRWRYQMVKHLNKSVTSKRSVASQTNGWNIAQQRTGRCLNTRSKHSYQQHKHLLRKSLVTR